jgi:hypothetical protein
VPPADAADDHFVDGVRRRAAGFRMLGLGHRDGDFFRALFGGGLVCRRLRHRDVDRSRLGQRSLDSGGVRTFEGL